MKYFILNIIFFLSFSFNCFSQSNFSNIHFPHSSPDFLIIYDFIILSVEIRVAEGCTDPVLVNGNWFNTETDIHYQLFGNEFGFERTYNSMGEFDRSFGLGWSHNFDMHLLRQDNGDIQFISENGRTLLLKKQKGDKEYYPENSYCPRLTHDENDNYQLLFEDGRLYDFDGTGKLISKEGKDGNKIKFTYDKNGFLIKIIDATKRGFELTNDSTGKITQIKDHTGRKVKYHYDEKDRLTKIILPDELIRKYAYDKKGRLTSLTNQNGDSYQFFFDKQNRMIKNVDPRGNDENFKYPKFLGLFDQRKIVFTDKRGNTWISEYNSKGKITKLTYPNGTFRKHKWDKKGNLIEIIFPDATKEIRQYDYRNNMTLYVNKIGDTTRYAYQENSNLVTKMEDAEGNITIFSYDDRGNVISKTDALGNTYQYTYNRFNSMVSETDPLGLIKKYRYDENGNLSKITYPSSAESFTYDQFGNTISTTDENKNVYYYEYDILNRPVKMTDPMGAITRVEYGTTGEISKMIDANGNETSYSYIVLSGSTDNNELRKIAKIQTPTHHLKFDYDEIGNLTSFTNGENNTTSFAYNALNLLVEETNSLGQSIKYNYDLVGNLIERKNPNGESIIYDNDKLGRVIRKTYEGNVEQYAYNAKGNIIEASNNNIRIYRKYDALERLTEERYDNWGKTIEYEYDAAGNRISMIDPNKGVTSYRYNKNYHGYHLSEIENPFSEITKFEYDIGGRIKKQSNANGSFVNYQFNQANHLIGLTNNLTEEKIASGYSYGYDQIGNRLFMEYQDGSRDNYEYDELHQIIGVNYGDGVQEDYQYDLAGNRKTMSENRININYEYDAADRILKAGNTGFSHDENGNLIEKNEDGRKTRYHYDGENKLTSINLPNGLSLMFEYDPFGRRIKRTVDNETTCYIYDSFNLLMETDVDGKTKVQYTTGLELDQLISMNKDDKSYFYHTDGLGSIVGMSNESNEMVNQYSYNIFGKIKDFEENVSNNFAFTGREIESEAGLLFLRGRFYDNQVGRFINEDPIRHEGGVNLFVYAANNPINFIDPLGTHLFITSSTRIIVIRIFIRIIIIIPC